jgi:CRISPR/Cas system-associated exonuclease Cas4 (RecB family)
MQGKGTIDKPFKISPSQLGSFSDCACCYWLSHNGVKKPSGITAGLPMGMDTTFRRYYRGHADAGTVPSEISSDPRFKGWSLSNDIALVSKEIRVNPRDHIVSTSGAHYSLGGKMDEMMVDDTGKNVIIDFKTKASKNSSDKGPHPSAVRQMAAYAWIMESNGIPVRDEAYLAHLYPVNATDGPMVEFSRDFFVVNVDTNEKNAIKDLMGYVVVCLEGAEPARNADCEHCQYRA